MCDSSDLHRGVVSTVLSLSECQCLSVVSHCVEIDTIDIIDVIDIIDAFRAFPFDGLFSLEGLFAPLGL